jgi:hypothetical protein
VQWRFWAGRKARLVLALIGVIILGAGLSAISLLTETIKGTVVRTYEQTWRAPYDILVHVPLPEGTKLPDLTEPNVLTTLPPGITVAQLEQVRQVPGIQVAAPIAVVGYVRAGPIYEFPSMDPANKEFKHPGPGLYRITSRVVSQASGVPEELVERSLVYFPDPRTRKVPDNLPPGTLVADGRQLSGTTISTQIPTFLVGVDPVAESRLVGLENALIRGRYLDAAEPIGSLPGPDERPIPIIPVLVNTHAFQDISHHLTIEELDENLQVKRTVLNKLVEGEQLPGVLDEGAVRLYTLSGQSGPLAYKPVESPFPERWPVAFSLHPTEADLAPSLTVLKDAETSVSLGRSFRSWTPSPVRRLFSYDIKGFFDSAKLSVVKDPVSHMPLMTYRPAEALHVLDPQGRPINPPRRVSGGLSPVSFLSAPPALLTTIQGAVALAGDRAINAIQVKVEGAEHLTPETLTRVRQVAQEIERRTGLVAEVTMGSSPMNVLVQVPASGKYAPFGWVEERWIHKDAAVTTIQQVEFGYSAFIGLVLAVAALYGMATALAGITARRRELGVAIAVGWPTRSLAWLAAGEQLLFAALAGLLGAVTAALGGSRPSVTGMVLLASFLLYLPAILVAAWAAARTPPGDALRFGDTAPSRRVMPGTGILSLASSSLLGRPVRTLLTSVAIALPTALLMVLLFISRHLNGVLYTTVTGEYAALRVSPLQYVAGLVALAIAAVTAFDLIRQNAVDRRPERALLSALGWPRRWIAATMVAEGGLLGVFAGLLGVAGGLGALGLLYGGEAIRAWPQALLAGVLPILLGLLTGLIGSLPEQRAWDRSEMAGVSASQVARLGPRTFAAAAAASLLLIGAAGVVAIPHWIAQFRAQQASAKSAGDRATAEIEAAVALQNGALERLDIEAFLRTIDPLARAYLMEQRHWLESAQRWQQAHPSGKIARSLGHVTLLGENTARVRLIQTVDGDLSSVLETVWTRTRDGQWLEHGLWQEVLEESGVSVWYSDLLSPEVARAALKNAQEAAEIAGRLGWRPDSPIILELKPNREALYASIGPDVRPPNLVSWTEFGEPIRAFPVQGRVPGVGSLLRLAVMQTIMEKSHNHAADWLRLGLSLHVQAEGLGSLPRLMEEYRAHELLPLTQLANQVPFYQLSDDDFAAAERTTTLLTLFLKERFGHNALHEVIERLAEQPADPRMLDRVTKPDRDRATIAAIEQVTGKSWYDLDQELRAWWQSKRQGR